jgi:hypothetical protein
MVLLLLLALDHCLDDGGMVGPQIDEYMCDAGLPSVSDGIPRDFGCRLYLPEGLEEGEGGGIELLRPHVWDDLVLQGVKGRH